MAASYQQVDDDLRRVAAEGSGLPITHLIPEQENAPAPDGLYGCLVFVSEERPAWPAARLAGSAAEGLLDEDLAITVHGRFDIQFYRPGALAAAQRLRSWLEGSLGVLAMQRIGMALVRPPVFRRLDALVPDPVPVGADNSVDIEERAGLEVTVAYCLESRQQVGCIEAVPITAPTAGGTAHTIRVQSNGS